MVLIFLFSACASSEGRPCALCSVRFTGVFFPGVCSAAAPAQRVCGSEFPGCASGLSGLVGGQCRVTACGTPTASRPQRDQRRPVVTPSHPDRSVGFSPGSSFCARSPAGGTRPHVPSSSLLTPPGRGASAASLGSRALASQGRAACPLLGSSVRCVRCEVFGEGGHGPRGVCRLCPPRVPPSGNAPSGPLCAAGSQFCLLGCRGVLLCGAASVLRTFIQSLIHSSTSTRHSLIFSLMITS